MKQKFTIASQKNPEFSSYSDIDIQNQYASADNKRKALILQYDAGIDVENELDSIHSLLFRLDNELCARGF